LDAIAERGARLCDASNGTIILSDGEALRMEAHYGPLARQVALAEACLLGAYHHAPAAPEPAGTALGRREEKCTARPGWSSRSP